MAELILIEICPGQISTFTFRKAKHIVPQVYRIREADISRLRSKHIARRPQTALSTSRGSTVPYILNIIIIPCLNHIAVFVL